MMVNNFQVLFEILLILFIKEMEAVHWYAKLWAPNHNMFKLVSFLGVLAVANRTFLAFTGMLKDSETGLIMNSRNDI